jgi:ubiquitin C-terminal hydrolase
VPHIHEGKKKEGRKEGERKKERKKERALPFERGLRGTPFGPPHVVGKPMSVRTGAQRVRSRAVADGKSPKVLPRGFRNLGNSCFLNAVVQSLASVRTMHAYLQRVRQEAPASVTDKMLACQLQLALHETTSTQQRGSNAPAVASHPAVARRFLRTRRQQDAHELMQFLLDGVEAEAGVAHGGGSASFASLVEDTPSSSSDRAHSAAQSPGAKLPVWGFLDDDDDDDLSQSLLPDVISASDDDPDLTKPRDPFVGMLSETLVFSLCNHRGESRSTPFRDLSLPVPLGEERRKHNIIDTIEDYLRYFTISEVVEDVRCEKCDENVRSVRSIGGAGVQDAIRTSRIATKQLSVLRPPEALCLHIRRLVSNGVQMVKHSHHVDFDLQLDLFPYCADNTQRSVARGSRSEAEKPAAESAVFPLLNLAGMNISGSGGSLSPKLGWSDASDTEQASRRPSGSLLYDLVSVVVHHGSAQGGHYTAYRRVSRDSSGRSDWVHVSDEKVHAVSESDVLQSQAYMLYYELSRT